MPVTNTRSSRTPATIAAWTLALAVLCGPAPRCIAAGEEAQFEGFWKVDADPDNSAERGGRLEFQEYFIIESGVGDRLRDVQARFRADRRDLHHRRKRQGHPDRHDDQPLAGDRDHHRVARDVGEIVWERDGQTYRYAYTGTPFTPASE